MDDIHTAVPSNTTDATKKKNRPPKLSPAVLAALPGTDAVPVRKAKPEYMNSLVFHIPVTGAFGLATEAGQVHDFAYQLNAQAKAKALGSVSSVSVADGVFDVVLRLEAGGDKVNPSAAAIDAAAKLQEFMVSSAQLKQGPAGKPGAYDTKANGTTTGSKNF